MMHELLLELFSEEIPANMQKNAASGYTEIFSKGLQSIGVPFDRINVYVGPRRITVHISGIPETITSDQIEFKGPRVGSPISAVEGFCRSYNIKKEELTVKSLKGQDVYMYLQKEQLKAVTSLLQEFIPQAIDKYIWPKSMYWGDYEMRWVRPLKNILCLFAGKELNIKYGHLTSNNITYGHRFLSKDPISVRNFMEYNEALGKAYVIVNHEERSKMIEDSLAKLAHDYNLVIKPDPRLLEEVTGLVEYPSVMIGSIDKKFLSLPTESLVASMRSHQKYFSTFDKSGNFAPYFLFASNILPDQYGSIVQGNERVLSARLSDALYFYKEDLKIKLEQRIGDLEKITFHEKLGSLGDKLQRIVSICKFLSPSDKELHLAASLCKSDLTSEMVGEFPELQGVMGYTYAMNEGISQVAAEAIRDHYKPQGPLDTVPKGISALLAIADKVDSLTGLIIAGEHPTGSKDPYALRRIALGIIRIILENKLEINILDLVKFSSGLYNKQDATHQIMNFIEDRVRFYFKSDYDIILINSILDLASDSNILNFFVKLSALDAFLKTKQGQNTADAHRRVRNILGDNILEGTPNQELFVTDYEKDLFDSLMQTTKEVDGLILAKDFSGAIKQLTAILGPISRFFDNVLIKEEDAAVAKNRLLLVRDVKTLFDKVARFYTL